MSVAGLILPDVEDVEAAGFWEGCALGELRVQTCGACGTRRMPPRPMCPACRSLEARWEPLSGAGHVWSFVIPHPPLLASYGEQAPYNVVVVELDDDPAIRFVGNVVSEPGAPLNAIDPHEIAIGDAVRVVFARLAEDVWVPQWVRV